MDDPVLIAEQLADELAGALTDVGPADPDEYRRGQRRAYLDAARRVRRTFGLPDPHDPAMPWCESCRSYHVVPHDGQHKFELGCRAPTREG